MPDLSLVSTVGLAVNVSYINATTKVVFLTVAYSDTDYVLFLNQMGQRLAWDIIVYGINSESPHRL